MLEFQEKNTFLFLFRTFYSANGTNILETESFVKFFNDNSTYLSFQSVILLTSCESQLIDKGI